MKELGDLPYVDFGKRLKALRLQANITTQRELVDLLADKDVYYDYTVVSHWESGRRCSSLQTLIAIIQVLVEAGGIKDVAAANELLRLADMRGLSKDEVALIFRESPFGIEKVEENSALSKASQINTNIHDPDQQVIGESTANIEQQLEEIKALLEPPMHPLPPGLASWFSSIPDERYYPLPGRERDLDRLLEVLQDHQGFPVIVIDGLGGLGKTAMAVELTRRALGQGTFKGVIGDSAKQELLSGGEIVQVREATLNFDGLLDAIARQLERWELTTRKTKEKRIALTHLIRQHGYLVLVDNLETAENANSLVAHLRGLLNGGRAIVTSRKQVRHDFVHSLSLTGLELGDSLFFLRTDAEQRDVHQILEADEGRLVEIHEITGGAPLALKLVVAQARFLDLDLILRQLRQAKGNLYPFIFRQSWAQLPPAAQRLLIYIGRTVATTAGWEELASVGIAKNEEELMEAVGQLVACSLLNTSFIAGQTRYGVHQLTRQFVNGDLPEIWRQQGLL